MNYSFTNLKQPKNTTSGVAQFMLLAPVYDFTEGGIKCPAAPFTLPGDKATIKAPHEFKPTRAFAKILLAPNKNKLDAKSIGDIGFSKTDITLDAFIAGSYAELHEAMTEYLNQPLVVLVPDAECDADIYYQLGCDCSFAYLTFDFTTGTEKDGIKGYNAKVTCAGKGVKLYAPEVLGVKVAPEVLAD